MTTVALAVTAAWPRELDGGVRPVLVEADAGGGDLAARFRTAHSPGLLDVAASAHRDRPGTVLGAVQELPVGVRAVLAPAGARQCAEAIRAIGSSSGEVLAGGDGEHGTVLLDAGRIQPGSAVGLADEVVLLSRGGVEALSHVYAYTELLGEEDAKELTLVVVGPCPYREAEILQTLKVGRVVFLPWDPRSAEALAGCQELPARRRGRRVWPLMKAAEQLAYLLAGGVPSSGQLAPALAESVQAPALGAAERVALTAPVHGGGDMS
ncbi:MinD/ParA family ATP-binding protein [Streptomyces boninensis]|uniref:MinD/ParA family ATP-binding protein n=1 Tax=Streptomyces boninensis TaxID=2039455 RepID=UPI003B2284EB